MKAMLFVVLSTVLLKSCAEASNSIKEVSENSSFRAPAACGNSFDLTDDGVNADIKFLLHVIRSVKWKSMTVISDGTPAFAGTVLTQYLPCDVVRMVFELPSAAGFADWMKGIMAAEIPSVNFVVMGNFSFLRQVFSETDQTGEILFHWLTIMPRVYAASFSENVQEFDHVAAVINEPDGWLTLETIVRRGDATALSFVADYSPFKNSSMPKLRDDTVFPNVKYGFSGRTLKMVTKTWTPFVTRHQNDGSTSYTGLCMDLLEVLSTELNFTYTITEPGDGIWGSKLPNGTWAGMIGMLHRKEVDFALTGLSVTADRSTVTDYTLGFYFDEIVMVTKWPDPMPLGWTFYTRPFHWHVYVLMGSCLLFTTFALVCLERLYVRTYNWQRGKASRRRVPFIAQSMLEAAETLFGVFIGRAVIYEGVSNSGRVLLSSWLLLSLVTIATYTGKLISNSVVVQQPLPFNTLGELVQRTDYTWGFGKGTMLDNIFAESQDPHYKQFYQKMLSFAEDDPEVRAADMNTVALGKILRSNFVRLSSYSGFQYLANEHCQLTVAKERLFHDTLAIYLQKHSPYQDKFNKVLSQTTESGLLYYLARKWFPDLKICRSEGTTVAPVTVELMQSAFALALAGLVLAVILLGLECLANCKKIS